MRVMKQASTTELPDTFVAGGEVSGRAYGDGIATAASAMHTCMKSDAREKGLS